MPMSTTHSIARSRHAAPRRGSYGRRGVVALTAIWMLVIFLLIAAWVLNYNFLVLVNRDMQQKCDAIVLAAAPALLDEDILRDYPDPPVADQTDDFAEAVAVADQYRRLNNRIQSRALEIHGDDMTVASGYVADVTGGSSYRFDTSIPLDVPVPPHNTLRILSRRSNESNHPVRYILDLFNAGTPRTADVRSGSHATLDNLVIGFRPSATEPSPVMPLGIDVIAWNSERASGGDSNTNQIREMVLRLDIPRPDLTDANATLLFFSDVVDFGALSTQMERGLLAGDVPADGKLGPATVASPWSAAAMRQVDQRAHPGLNDELAALLNDLAAAGEAKRVFPLCSSFADADLDGVGAARLVGFVAAEVLYAGVVDDRLTVVVEPCFIINHTAWTVGPDHGSQPQRNPYIHKLRLSN